MDAKSAKKLTAQAVDRQEKTRRAAAEKLRVEKLLKEKKEVATITETINKSLDTDIKKAAKAGRTSFTYSFPWAERATLYSDLLAPLFKSLRNKGFTVAVYVHDEDMGKSDIDYWGCFNYTRDITISW